jgi:hypothetical protein
MFIADRGGLLLPSPPACLPPAKKLHIDPLAYLRDVLRAQHPSHKH